MTWSVRMTRFDGTVRDGDYSACQSCKHSELIPVIGNELRERKVSAVPCQVYKMQYHVGSILTAIDMGADGHMAGGVAVLQCNGWEERVPEKG